MGNLMRQIGRMGISMDGGSNAMGAMVSGGLGGAAFGPLGLLMPVVGTGARKIGEMSTSKSAARLQGLAAAGGVPQLPAIAPRIEPGLVEALSRVGRGAGIALEPTVSPLLGR